MKRNMIITLLIGFLLGIAATHQNAKAIQNDVTIPRPQMVDDRNARRAIDVLQSDLERHEIMIAQLRRTCVRRGESW